jgi:hypothetical protein
VIFKGIVDKVDVERKKWWVKETGRKKYGITLFENMIKLGKLEVWSYENLGLGEEVEVKIEKKSLGGGFNG